MSSPTHLIHQLAESLAPIRTTLDSERVMVEAIAIQQIPAPTFFEERRAAYLRERFAAFPLHDVAVDEVYNVIGRWPGEDSSRPALLISAHTDTVFSMDTDLTIRHEDGLVYGPGLGDNSLGVAALLALLEVFQTHRIRPPVDIWFAANSREEGLGDLGGIKAVWNQLGTRLGAAIVVEGMALGRIYRAGIAVRRLHITCHTPGGHSWLHFGQPSAIHGLVQLGARITALQPPDVPRTTYNIGLIGGGHSVNSIATTADLYLDLRSESPDSLRDLEQQVRAAIEAVRVPFMDFTVEIVGDRPAGQIGLDHPLVQMAMAALEAIHHQAILETGSTDANVLLANGLPAVTVGISYGGHAHRLDEYIETGPVADGLWHVLLLALAAARQLGEQ